MRRLMLVIGCLVVVSSGCVSQQRYLSKEREATHCAATLDAERLIKKESAGRAEEVTRALRSERDQLQRSLNGSERDVTLLEDEMGALVNEMASLADERQELSKRGQLADARRRHLEAQARQLEMAKRTHERLIDALKDELDAKLVEVKRLGARSTVTLNEKILFDSGSAELQPAGVQALAKIAKVLQDAQENEILVEGHTDSIPIGDELAERFPSNWDLAAARAITVVRQLQTGGVNPRRMAAVSRAEYAPKRRNATPSGRQANRRTEIHLTPPDVVRSSAAVSQRVPTRARPTRSARR